MSSDPRKRSAGCAAPLYLDVDGIVQLVQALRPCLLPVHQHPVYDGLKSVVAGISASDGQTAILPVGEDIVRPDNVARHSVEIAENDDREVSFAMVAGPLAQNREASLHKGRGAHSREGWE